MGLSDREVDDLTLDARVRDVEAVTERLGLERFVLAGCDIGAATALAFAARHLERVAKLVLISPWASGARMFALPALRVARAAMMSGEREWSVFTNVLASVATAFDTGQLGRDIALAMQESSSPHGLAAYYRTTEAIDLGSVLPGITTQSLVMHERAFPFGSFELCKEVAAWLPDARLLVVQDPSIAGSAHHGYASAIDRFLRGTETLDTARQASEAPAAPVPSELTTREMAILNRVARGFTNKEVARELGIAVPTVERHLANIYTKIGARRRADATAYAVRHGLDRTTD